MFCDIRVSDLVPANRSPASFASRLISLAYSCSGSGCDLRRRLSRVLVRVAPSLAGLLSLLMVGPPGQDTSLPEYPSRDWASQIIIQMPKCGNCAILNTPAFSGPRTCAPLQLGVGNLTVLICLARPSTLRAWIPYQFTSTSYHFKP